MLGVCTHGYLDLVIGFPMLWYYSCSTLDDWANPGAMWTPDWLPFVKGTRREIEKLELMGSDRIYTNPVKQLFMNTTVCAGEGDGSPLQYSCLENPMDGGAWWAAVRGIAKSQTRLSDFTFTFHFSLSCLGEGNGNPLQCSCLENPRDRGALEWTSLFTLRKRYFFFEKEVF